MTITIEQLQDLLKYCHPDKEVYFLVDGEPCAIKDIITHDHDAVYLELGE